MACCLLILHSHRLNYYIPFSKLFGQTDRFYCLIVCPGWMTRLTMMLSKKLHSKNLYVMLICITYNSNGISKLPFMLAQVIQSTASTN